jgi:hypothetical protein
MQTFSSSEILELWEQGRRFHPLDRSLLALSAAVAATSEEVADWPLGRRNRALIELHAACFGAQLQGWSACPVCGEKIEFDVDGRRLLDALQPKAIEATVTVCGESFRLPTSRDLYEVLTGDPESAAYRLLERCRMGDVPTAEWNEDTMSEVSETLAAADPLADVSLALDCPSCSHQWNDTLDIGSFVWAEIESRARRVLWEVHMLASAYGWTEAETLHLSALRRANYLRMVQA